MKRCRLFLPCALSGVLCAPLIGRANDSFITGVGGSMRPMEGEHKSVRMVRENIRIEVNSYAYTTWADFVFHNDGPATTVRMGFPEGGGGVDVDAKFYRNKSSFDSFATWVDGRRVKVHRTPATKGAGDGYEAWWIKTVAFKTQQKRRIRVRYRSQMGHSSAPHEASLGYDFTGGNWHSKVDQSDLLIVMKTPGAYWANPSWGNMLVPQQRHLENRFFYRWRDWQAQGYFHWSLKNTLPGRLNIADAPELTGSLEGWKPFSYRASSMPWNKSVRRVDVLPPMVLRNGVTFISVRALESWWQQRLANEKDVQVKWDETTQTATLQDTSHTFVFSSRSKQMQHNGRSVPLRASPFKVFLGAGWGGHLYVPLAPVINALGGEVKVDAKAHRVQFSAPMG